MTVEHLPLVLVSFGKLENHGQRRCHGILTPRFGRMQPYGGKCRLDGVGTANVLCQCSAG
jgi:hypothetical protein